MAIVPGRDEMYVWIYNSNENDIGIFQTKTAGRPHGRRSPPPALIPAAMARATAAATIPPARAPTTSRSRRCPTAVATDLYAGGVNEYKCTINSVTNPTCTASPFLNLTHVYGCSPTANIAHVHPDEHGVDFLGNDGTGAFFAAHPGFDPPIFFGNDGGVYRVAARLLADQRNVSGIGYNPAQPIRQPQFLHRQVFP